MNVGPASRRARRSTRWTARIGIVALIASAFVLATGTSVWADAADVSTTTGTILNTGTELSDGFVNVSVQGTWAWTTHKTDCNNDRYAAGWAVAWNDAAQDGNFVANLNGTDINVGVADGSQGSALNDTDNAVHVTDPPRCGVFASHGALSYNTGDWGADSDTGDTTHKYALPDGTDTQQELNDFIATIKPCAVMYDVHGNSTAPNNPSKDLKAGGTGHNDDNSIQKNQQTPAGNVCAAIDVEPIPPDVSVVKTGPAQVTLGDTITYTITVTNTGEVDVVPSLTDQLPAGTSFVSASSNCHQDDEDATLVACAIGLLHAGDSAQVQITVLTLQTGTVVNTAVVTPDDETPNDNTSSVSTGVVEAAPAAAAVEVTPAFTG